MDPRTAKTERNMIPGVGPAFFRGDDGTVCFRFVIDTGNVIGPRPATRADQEKHAAAWSAFAAAEGVSSLDRDASGGDGGSLPAEPESPAAPVEAKPERIVEVVHSSANAEPKGAEAATELEAAAPPAKKPRKPYTRRKKG